MQTSHRVQKEGTFTLPSPRLKLTVFRLPPLCFSLWVEGRDYVFNAVAVGVAMVIVWQTRVTCKAFLPLLMDEDTLNEIIIFNTCRQSIINS